MDSELKSRLDYALSLSQKAGLLAMKHYQGVLQIEKKADESLVTNADKEIEKILRKEIEKIFPKDGIVGEEFGIQSPKNKSSSSYTWTLDPIDGTTSFSLGVPFFGVLIGVMDENLSPLVGVCHFPALDETAYAIRGGGTFHKKPDSKDYLPCRVSKKNTLSESLVCHSGEEHFRKVHLEQNAKALFQKAELVRTWGDSYGHLLVATGRAEMMLDPVFKIWDLIPVKIVVEEAGGFCPGGPFKKAPPDQAAFNLMKEPLWGVSSNGVLKKELIKGFQI